MQYLAYGRLLSRGLRDPNPSTKRRALRRWFAFAVAWQAVVLAAVAAYAFPASRSHSGSYAWALPPLGAILGTALPLQLAVLRITRSMRYSQ